MENWRLVWREGIAPFLSTPALEALRHEIDCCLWERYFEMNVRAKFKCDSVEHTVSGTTVKMTPVVSGSEENKRFYKYTPQGGLTLSTVNTEAAKQFEPGKEYYLDFTAADVVT